VPPASADPRGPRILDPFACETLAFTPPSREAVAHRDPLDEPTLLRAWIEPPEATAVPGEQLDDPTLVYRPWAREFALQPLARTLEASLAKTISQPVTAPLAVTISAPMPSPVALQPGRSASRPTASSRSAPEPRAASAAQTPLVRQCIAGLIVAALLLLGVRALTGPGRIPPARTAAPAASSSTGAIIAASGAASAHAARNGDQPRNADLSPPPVVDGKTAERQAVDLVARGAYSEAAALYDRLVRWSDSQAFREAARIARRKARLAR